MQQEQQNYNPLLAAALTLFATVLLCSGLGAEPIARPSAPDLLSDGKPGPCDPRLDRPDYVGQVDVAGNSVAPADLPAVRNPVPSEILVPLSRGKRGRGDGPVAALDGRALEPLLNPVPNCGAKPR